MLRVDIRDYNSYITHKRKVETDLSAELMISPDIVSKLINKGLNKNMIKFDDFYNTTKGFIYMEVNLV